MARRRRAPKGKMKGNGAPQARPKGKMKKMARRRRAKAKNKGTWRAAGALRTKILRNPYANLIFTVHDETSDDAWYCDCNSDDVIVNLVHPHVHKKRMIVNCTAAHWW